MKKYNEFCDCCVVFIDVLTKKTAPRRRAIFDRLLGSSKSWHNTRIPWYPLVSPLNSSFMICQLKRQNLSMFTVLQSVEITVWRVVEGIRPFFVCKEEQNVSMFQCIRFCHESITPKMYSTKHEEKQQPFPTKWLNELCSLFFLVLIWIEVTFF